MTTNPSYESFLKTASRRQWERVGLKRRSGVTVPLFSVYSSDSVGIGELPDLKLLVDWCRLTGLSIVQLLPMNDVGFDFRPYDAQSSFALEPVYLSLSKLKDVKTGPWKREIGKLKSRFPAGTKRVNYQVKEAKLKLLWGIFCGESGEKISAGAKRFFEENRFWLRDYALFKVIKERENQSHWLKWEERLKERDEESLKEVERKYQKQIRFHQWLQWQLYEQFREVKRYAESGKVLLMGDLPFLVSHDSADVWAHQNYFKLDLSSGAPPDLYYALGQRWGMPPYRWEEVEAHQYDWLIQKLSYAESFYDLFRVDHVVGAFRIWTIPASEPMGTSALNGRFDPSDERVWEGQGRRLLSCMLKNTTMLLCGEDLGTVPECSYRVLEDYGIPGMDVQRWMQGREYRKNSIAIISTHDMIPLRGWWRFEAGTIEERLKFWRYLGLKGSPGQTAPHRFIQKALQKISQTRSIFSIQLIIDWLSLSREFQVDPWSFRINSPGTISQDNWSAVIPFPLETINRLKANQEIREINIRTERSPSLPLTF